MLATLPKTVGSQSRSRRSNFLSKKLFFFACKNHYLVEQKKLYKMVIFEIANAAKLGLRKMAKVTDLSLH